uniref:Signal peptidase complex subunit 1 n=1 Tax=Callorhinchus milii TaxID=7868 RepID=A0A4W3HQB1_CALMI
MFPFLKAVATHMDYKGQQSAEQTFQRVIVAAAVIGFIYGYIVEQFGWTVYIVLAGFAISCLEHGDVALDVGFPEDGLDLWPLLRSAAQHAHDQQRQLPAVGLRYRGKLHRETRAEISLQRHRRHRDKRSALPSLRAAIYMQVVVTVTPNPPARLHSHINVKHFSKCNSGRVAGSAEGRSGKILNSQRVLFCQVGNRLRQ